MRKLSPRRLWNIRRTARHLNIKLSVHRQGHYLDPFCLPTHALLPKDLKMLFSSIWMAWVLEKKGSGHELLGPCSRFSAFCRKGITSSTGRQEYIIHAIISYDKFSWFEALVIQQLAFGKIGMAMALTSVSTKIWVQRLVVNLLLADVWCSVNLLGSAFLQNLKYRYNVDLFLNSS